jgi:hypothetical protein
VPENHGDLTTAIGLHDGPVAQQESEPAVHDREVHVPEALVQHPTVTSQEDHLVVDLVARIAFGEIDLETETGEGETAAAAQRGDSLQGEVLLAAARPGLHPPEMTEATVHVRLVETATGIGAETETETGIAIEIETGIETGTETETGIGIGTENVNVSVSESETATEIAIEIGTAIGLGIGRTCGTMARPPSQSCSFSSNPEIDVLALLLATKEATVIGPPPSENCPQQDPVRILSVQVLAVRADVMIELWGPTAKHLSETRVFPRR